MLKSGNLESPFLDHPPTGSLPTLRSFKPITNASELQPKSSLTRQSVNLAEPQRQSVNLTEPQRQSVNLTEPQRQSVNTQVPNLTEPQSVYSSGASNIIHTRTAESHNDRDELHRPHTLRDVKAHTGSVTDKYMRGIDTSAHRHRKPSHKHSSSSRSRSNSHHSSDPHTGVSASKSESWSMSASQPLYLVQTNVPTGVGVGMSSANTGNVWEERVGMQRPRPQTSDRGYWSQDKSLTVDHQEVGFQPPLTSTLTESNPLVS